MIFTPSESLQSPERRSSTSLNAAVWTAGLAAPPFAGDPDAVARRVLRAIDAGRPVVYAPAIWGWILWVIRKLPRAVMRRLDF